MEHMINNELVKKMRTSQKWSQEALASISGLSLRTVQRIENNGRCSQESQKALAAAFEIDASELDVDLSQQNSNSQHNANSQNSREINLAYAFAGAIVGLLCAFAVITYCLIQGVISYFMAGLSYGLVGAFCGICLGIVGLICNSQNSKVQKLAYVGVLVGLLCAYVAITYLLIPDIISFTMAGISYGLTAALCGICFVIVNLILKKPMVNKT